MQVESVVVVVFVKCTKYIPMVDAHNKTYKKSQTSKKVRVSRPVRSHHNKIIIRLHTPHTTHTLFDLICLDRLS